MMDIWKYSDTGMNLRDYFAAAALTGLLANSYNDAINKPLSLATRLDIAEMAYAQADVMLLERERTTAASSEAKEKT